MKVISTDPGRWIGFANGPAETVSWCAWVQLGKRTFYVFPWRIFIDRTEV
jgi:hypothetical protein